MKRLQPVIWSKGTFLTPQHLQAQDRYVEDLLHFQMDALEFRSWGFSKVQIDERKLAEGQFALLSAEGMFPDGLSFDIPNSDAGPASRIIREFFSEQRPVVRVFLAVPEQREHAPNLGSSIEVKTRYIGELRNFRDENTGMSEKPIQLARKNLLFLLEGESQEGCSVIEVARVEKTQDGKFLASINFVPPMTNVHDSSQLKGILRGLLETISSRAAILAGMRRQKNESLADFTTADVANFWLLYTINSNLPLLRHLFHKTRVHPEQLFNVMLSFAGSLTTFSMTVQPRDLPQYDHENLWNCFNDLEQKIRLLLKTVVPANFVSLPLKQVRPTIYATQIEEDAYLKGRFYLAVTAEMREPDLISRAPQIMKAGAAGHLEEIIKLALPGLKMLHVPVPPAEIPLKVKYKYFSLDLTGDAWDKVQRSRTFGVHVPNDIPNAQLELVILLPTAR